MPQRLAARLLPLWLLTCATVIAGPLPAARADVALPNSTVIPQSARLADLLNGSPNNDNLNEGLSGTADAAIEPQVFSPLCDFSAKFIAKGGGANFAIGWYNVDNARASNNPPRYKPVNIADRLNEAAAGSDIQLLFPFSDALPPVDKRDLKAASIRGHAAYKGGQIGFALVPNPIGTGNGNATQYHYTEHRFNVQCTRCARPGPWYSHLIYRSKKLDNTFYLGFEDLDFLDDANNGTNGNDLDYEDFLFRFTGIACVGAGEACTIAANQGVCQLGVKDCDGQGKLICRALARPGQNAERCDGVDNNCDGQVDEGAPCPVGQICDRGHCTGACGSEFPCGGGLTCDRGRCVDPPCVGKTCAANQVCRNGACVSPCEGIKCPAPSICSGGTCLDPCAGVTCGAKKTCVNGACVPTCDCQPCATGLACAAASGQCVASGCETMTCGPGDTCQGGRCVPACTGAVCPSGQVCKAGQCQDVASPGLDLGGGEDPGGGASVASGCGCRVEGGRGGGAGAVLSLCALLLVLGLRRRSGRA